MEIVSDLHLHSKYSRAVSQQMTLDVMAKYAGQKGLDLLTTADWTHPLWFKEIKNLLTEKSEGIYGLKLADGKEANIRFLLSTEISSIYKQGDKLRRIHNLIFVPNLDAAEKVNQALLKQGRNLSSDGRPIIGLSARDLLELILSIDDQCMLIPCHAWTPHFGVYGSASGFDSLQEAFVDLTKNIYAIETGISSDPDMNWQIPELQNRSIVSFSDAHSPAKMGREATVFVSNNPPDGEMTSYSYSDIVLAIKRERNAKLKIGYTIEFYPEEGKYHFSGHRSCKISYGPNEVKENGTTCPVCKKKMTEGVLVRVQQLAGKESLETAEKKKNSAGLQWFTDPAKKHPPFVKLVPLLEIIAESLHSTVSSQKVQALYAKLCDELDSELQVILKTSISDIARVGGEAVAQGVRKVREGDIVIVPGFDGEYGKVSIWQEEEKKLIAKTKIPQLSLDF